MPQMTNGKCRDCKRDQPVYIKDWSQKPQPRCVACGSRLDWVGYWVELPKKSSPKPVPPSVPKKKSRKQPAPQPKPWVGTYPDYLKSDWWKSKRKQKIRSAGNKCERCGHKGKLQVHHKHYKTLGREKHADLEVLCWGCHGNEHEGDIHARDHMDSLTREVRLDPPTYPER